MTPDPSITRDHGPGEARHDARLEELGAWCRSARVGARAEVEVYERRAWRIRVRCATDGSWQREEVVEGGTAVRLRSGDGTARFAALSGDGPEAVEAACSLARGLPAEPDPGWGTGPDLRQDDDAEAELPAAGDVEARLRAVAGEGSGWIEVARTEERWSFDGAGAARRTRLRSWLRWEGVREGRLRVEGASSRGWPLRAASDPGPPDVVPGLWHLAPEAAAPLLAALAGSGALRPGDPVGPGLVLSDEPDHPAGLAGGWFDDAGYRTVPTRLADGRTWLGVPAGPGHLLRPSYRDRPSPAPANLVLAARPVPGGGAERSFRGSRLFPGHAGAWLVVLEGEGGETILSAPPADLARRIVGTWGEPGGTRSGVRTPGLLVEGGG